MLDAKEVSIPFAQHFKLSHEQSPNNKSSMKEMSKIPYSNVVGSLMYSMVCTRPGLAHSMSVSSRFMAKPGRAHWDAVKWTLRYVNGTLDMSLVYGGAKLGEEPCILGFSDADYAADLDRRRSSTGYVFQLWNSTISWKTNLQPVVDPPLRHNTLLSLKQ